MMFLLDLLLFAAFVSGVIAVANVLRGKYRNNRPIIEGVIEEVELDSNAQSRIRLRLSDGQTTTILMLPAEEPVSLFRNLLTGGRFHEKELLKEALVVGHTIRLRVHETEGAIRHMYSVLEVSPKQLPAAEVKQLTNDMMNQK